MICKPGSSSSTPTGSRTRPRWRPTVTPISEVSLAQFRVADCRVCAGLLKPAVVFFGEQVPQAVVDRAYAEVEAAQLLLVVGSSLAVFSGLRFVKRAALRQIPVAIVNLGPTRGDEIATLKIEARLGEMLPELVTRLAGP